MFPERVVESVAIRLQDLIEMMLGAYVMEYGALPAAGVSRKQEDDGTVRFWVDHTEDYAPVPQSAEKRIRENSRKWMRMMGKTPPYQAEIVFTPSNANHPGHLLIVRKPVAWSEPN